MSLRNELNIIFFGMRRSGQHAILNWLAGHYDEPVWFFNDISAFAEPDKFGGDECATKLPIYVQNASKIENVWEQPKKVLFQTYEDKWYWPIETGKNDRVVGSSRKKIFVLFIRDPYNMFASRLCNTGPVFPCNDRSILMWKTYAREVLGRTEYRPQSVFINYNRWFKESEYRREIENVFGLNESDEWMNRVTGVGSTFSNKELDGKAHEMKVFERWKFAVRHPFFVKLIKDKEVRELSEDLFGTIIPDEMYNWASTL